MMEIDPSEFYFGNTYDLKTQAIIPDKLTYYDPQDLTTHMVITGMTGSGKTGMGIILLEEAALKGIPAILVDPKGDLTNHLLHFPDFLPTDFAPWVDADAAKREGQTVEQAAEAAAASWKKGRPRPHGKAWESSRLCHLHARLRFRYPSKHPILVESPGNRLGR